MRRFIFIVRVIERCYFGRAKKGPKQIRASCCLDATERRSFFFTIFYLKRMMFLVTLYFPSLFFFFSQSYHNAYTSAYIHELYSYCVLCLKVINSQTSFSCRLKQFFLFFSSSTIEFVIFSKEICDIVSLLIH